MNNVILCRIHTTASTTMTQIKLIVVTTVLLQRAVVVTSLPNGAEKMSYFPNHDIPTREKDIFGSTIEKEGLQEGNGIAEDYVNLPFVNNEGVLQDESGTLVNRYENEKVYFDQREIHGGIRDSDGNYIQGTTRIGEADGSRREGRQRSFFSDQTGKNFVTSLLAELAALMTVGLSWFAPAPVVPEVQCKATNGALHMGTCFSDNVCSSSGGVASGSCSGGGVCCIFPTVCGGVVSRNRTWFLNRDFPDYSRDSSDCTLTIQRGDPKVKQVRLDMTVLELGDAVQGLCLRDALTVYWGTDNNEVDLIPPLCGDNSGQHVYVNFGQSDLTVSLRMEGSLKRKWHVLITTVTPGQEVPSGCLQFYADPAATVKSLNYNSGSYLFKGDLDYDVCFPSVDRFANKHEVCERRTVDIDLRQSENDIRARRGFFRAGRSSKLPLVSTFNNDRQHQKFIRKSLRPSSLQRTMKEPHTRTVPTLYSLVSDPILSQIDNVMSQLKDEPNTGLESLLSSKSKLDEIKEQFSEKDEVLPEDVYYYYYYEDDPVNLLTNELNGAPREPVTDNYAVEHVQHEFVLMPDGSSFPGSYFVRAPANSNDDKVEKSNDTQNSNKYFHTGMIQGIQEYAQDSMGVDSQYPTPAYFQRPTSSPVNLLSPDHRVASILMYDPHLFATDAFLSTTDSSSSKQPIVSAASTIEDPPLQFTLNDLTTLSTINPDDEYTLKHDGVQWLFLKNHKATRSPLGVSNSEEVVLPHEVNISPVTDEAEGMPVKPHLVFKHPSGTVTEMHISAGDEGNEHEKIVTVIETGPISQNTTKIKINSILNLDQVLAGVFHINSESNSNSKKPVQNSDLPPTKLAYSEPTDSPYPDTTTNTQTTATEYVSDTSRKTSIQDVIATTQLKVIDAITQPPKNTYSSITPNVIDEDRFTTILNTKSKTKVQSTRSPDTSVPTRIIYKVTKRPGFSRPANEHVFTRLSSAPHLTVAPQRPPTTPTIRFSTRPHSTTATKAPEPIRFIKHQEATQSLTTKEKPRLSSLPSSTPTRFTQSQQPVIISQTTRLLPKQGTLSPQLSLTPTAATISQRPRPTILYTTRLTPSQTPPALPVAMQSPADPTTTGVPESIFKVLQDEHTRTTFAAATAAEDLAETAPPTAITPHQLPTTVSMSTHPTDPFTAMLKNMKVKTSTQQPASTVEPHFTISTLTNGVVTTKTYTNLEEALSHLKEMTKASVMSSQTAPSVFPTEPYTTHPAATSSAMPSLHDLITQTDVQLAEFNLEQCKNSYIKVDDVKVCDRLLRSEPIRNEAKHMFTNMKRMTVLSLGDSSQPLRFSLTYQTTCEAVITEDAMVTGDPAATNRVTGTTPPAGTTGPPKEKQINLFQYLLGWYR